MSTDIEDARDDAEVPPRKFIVQCPACEGTGNVVPLGSRALVGCRLCWGRGRVSRIAADSWFREQERQA
jgi:hypothetical protein